MFTFIDLVQPETLEEAFQILNSGKKNAVLGGCAFLKMSGQEIGAGIDLSKLNLDFIKEKDGFIEIGAMASLREIETSPLLNQAFNRILPVSVSHIIGVQFRNIVTLGGSVFSRYGFSDLLTALLALDTEVELFHEGRLPLEEFLNRPVKKDILIKVIIKYEQRIASYQCFRNSASDYPVLNAAVSKLDNRWRIAVGARPTRAALAIKASEALNQSGLLSETIDDAARLAAEELAFGTNLRGTSEYRQALCKVLVKRGITEVLECKSI